MPVVLRMLPDKDGKPSDVMRIHYFHRMEEGPIDTAGLKVPSRMGPVPMPMGMARGKIACTPRLNSLSPMPGPGGVSVAVAHSDDVRAVTCPECMETAEFKEQKKALDEVANHPQGT